MSIPILSSIFGEKPNIADYQPVNLDTDQLDQLLSDIKDFPQISEMGSLYQDYLLNAYDKAIPGFKDILALGGTTTKDMLSTADEELHGVIPKDVMAQVQESSAFQNLMSGGGGSMGDANTARNFGLTSLNLINQGAGLAGQAGNAAQRWASLSGAELPGFLQNAFITPFQRAQFDMEQNLIKRNIQQQKFNTDAAPNPIAKGLSDIVANLTAAYLSKGGSSHGAPATYGAGQMGVNDVAAPAFTPSYAPSATDSKDVGSPDFFNDTAALPTEGAGGTTGFDYGVGYPASNPSAYYGGNYFTDYMNTQGFYAGAFGG